MIRTSPFAPDSVSALQPVGAATDLFDEQATWQSIVSAKVAFAGWICSPEFHRSALRRRPHQGDQPLRPASARVYVAMFGRYLQALEHRGRSLLSARQTDASAFLDSLSAQSRIRWRYIRLLERLYSHLLERGFVGSNPFSDIAPLAALEAPGVDAPMASLNEAELSHLHLHVDAIVALALDHQRNGHALTSILETDLCVAAMVSVLVGAGLTVAELRHLRRADITPQPGGRHRKPWPIHVCRPAPSVKPHDTKLDVHWVAAVAAWMEINDGHRSRARALLFPSETGKPLVASTIHRRVEGCMQGAIADINIKACARTLRNTFAIQTLRTQGPEVAQIFLGHRSDQGIRRYIEAAKRI